MLDEPTNGKTLKTLVAEKTKIKAEKRKQQRDEEHESSDDSDDYSSDDTDSDDDSDMDGGQNETGVVLDGGQSDSDDESDWYDEKTDRVRDENGEWRRDY